MKKSLIAASAIFALAAGPAAAQAQDKPVKIGTTKKEVGRVSQAGKVAQARKDAGNR